MPSDWECSMNWDVRLNSCEKGKSEEWVEASNEMVRNTQKCNKGDQMHLKCENSDAIDVSFEQSG